MAPQGKLPYFDCMDYAVSHFFRLYDKDYRSVMISNFGFYYQPHKLFLDDKLHAFNKEIDEIIHNYSNMKCYSNVVEQSEIPNYVKETLNVHKILGINMDLFYCPWCPLYKKIHRKHVSIIMNFDSNNHEFYVYDPYFKTEVQTIDYKNLSNGLNYFFYLKPERNIEQGKSFNSLKQLCILLDETPDQRREKLNEFFDRIIHMEFYDYDINFVNISTFVYLFSLFIWSRYKAINYLNYVTEHYGTDVTSIKEELFQCINGWKAVSKLILKNIMLKKGFCNKRIQEIASELKLHEIKMLQLINSACS